MFARQLAKQNLFDPQNANRRKTGTYSLYTKENIMSWLQSPGTTSNAKNLRNASIYLYNSFNQYSRLIDYYAGLPLWAYVISPVAFNPGKVKDDVFKRQYLKVTQFFEDMNIPHEMHKAMKIALREGAFYGVFRKESGSCFIQKLNPDNCLISSISDGTYVFLYDMSSITDEQDLKILYPPEFSEMHRNYKKTGKPYQEVPDSISFCLKADDSVNDYTIPPFSSVMPLLLDISNYMDLQQTATELRNYAVLTGEIPTNADGTPQMDWPLVVEYLKQIYNALPPQIGCVAAPWKINQVSFNKNDGATDADLISRSADNFWSAAWFPRMRLRRGLHHLPS